MSGKDVKIVVNISPSIFSTKTSVRGSVEENIKERKVKMKINTEFLHNISQKMKEYFGTTSTFPSSEGMIFGLYSLDIVGFENFLKTKGYDPDREGSMKEFIEKKYGKDATDFIQSLLGYFDLETGKKVTEEDNKNGENNQ